MGFIKMRESNIRKKPKESAYFLPSFVLMAGAVTAFFLIQNDILSAFPAKNTGCIFSCICIFALIIIALSGLNLVGGVIVVCLDYLLGIIAAFMAADRLAFVNVFSSVWFFWATSIFFLVFCTLFISSESCGFSRAIYGKFISDSKFHSKLLKFVGLCLGSVLIFVFVLILAFRLNPELFV